MPLTPFVPADFVVPVRLDHPDFVLRPLLITDVVKDYDAVMTSVAQLRGIFGPDSDWPSPDLSFEQDLVDLGWHHKEFQRRSSFAYTVLDPSEHLCLGCTYLYPSARKTYDADAYCWIRSSHAAALDRALYEAFKTWLRSTWPFARVAFPGREVIRD
jgi:hypothetical protein